MITYAPELEPGQSISVNGRVLALVAKDDGTYVAHGVYAFGIRFYISYFGPAEPSPASPTRWPNRSPSMAAWWMAVFGTANSNAATTATTPEEPVWDAATAPVSRVAAPLASTASSPAATRATSPS